MFTDATQSRKRHKIGFRSWAIVITLISLGIIIFVYQHDIFPPKNRVDQAEEILTLATNKLHIAKQLVSTADSAMKTLGQTNVVQPRAQGIIQNLTQDVEGARAFLGLMKQVEAANFVLKQYDQYQEAQEDLVKLQISEFNKAFLIPLEEEDPSKGYGIMVEEAHAAKATDLLQNASLLMVDEFSILKKATQLKTKIDESGLTAGILFRKKTETAPGTYKVVVHSDHEEIVHQILGE